MRERVFEGENVWGERVCIKGKMYASECVYVRENGWMREYEREVYG